ncbi:MAG: SHOCT domain-containing protein [Desulfobacula sp.]|jgi:putative membrane protein|nr:SHOCT domain-containing protein [Desulfobacula sp.]
MIRKRIFFLIIILSTLILFACAQGPNRPMGNWGHMMGYGYGGGFMWLIVLALVGVVVYVLLQASKSKGSAGSITETSLDILEKRYAKGEITREEFDRMKADIKN